MRCFPCFGCFDKMRKEAFVGAAATSGRKQKHENNKHKSSNESPKAASNGNIAAHMFTFRELAAVTKNFRQDYLLGEGGFGRVYQGCLDGSGQIVAVKQLDRNGLQGNKEFLVEVLMLSHLHHPNLVNLIGYCADGEQRLLVYEFMPRGSVEDHLLDLSSEQKPLDWYRRMKIAYGAAQGLEYLHDNANPPVIYRDLKSSNILLDDDFMPKLSDFGLAKLGPMGDNTHVSSRVMGTYGYCAPEYARTGHLTPKSDVYSFGVVLLELITGRRVIDPMRPTAEQNLVSWAQPMFKDQKRFSELVDPLIKNNYPTKGLNQTVAVAAMCLQDEASVRPLMADVVVALSFLIDAPIVEHPKSSDSEISGRGVVEIIQLTEKKCGSARHDKDSSSRYGNDHGGLKHRRRPSQCGSDGSSSSKQSNVSSYHGSDAFDSDRSGDDQEEVHKSPQSTFKTPHGSYYGSMRSVSSRGSRHRSRISQESEYQSELM